MHTLDHTCDTERPVHPRPAERNLGDATPPKHRGIHEDRRLAIGAFGRGLALAFALVAVAPQAQAAPKHVGQAVITLASAYGGGIAGGLIGMGAYDLYDPYRRNGDDLEAFLIGGPVGFALGGWGGASISHLVMGSPVGSKVWITTGITALLGGGLVFATPALYENFQDNRFATAWVSGVFLSVVGLPFIAFGAVMFGSKKAETSVAVHAPSPKRLEVSIVPTISREKRGLTLSARF